MQLFVLALMLMAMGKNVDFKELSPVLEELGGGEAANVLKQAEQLSGVISAVQSIMPAATAKTAAAAGGNNPIEDNNGGEEEWAHGGFPLAPIAGIADERITYCLSRYVALGE